MSDLTIRLFPSDSSGCGFSRMIEPGRCVGELTADVTVQTVYHQDDDGGLEVLLSGRIGNDKVVGVADPECDVIVLQRPAHRHLIEAIPYIQAWGTAVVCEYDDDFNNIDPSNQAYAAYQPDTSPMMNKLWAQLGSQLADLVVVATPALAKIYGSHGRAVVLPNCVPESYLSVKPQWDGSVCESDAPRVGWAGVPHSHPGDLQVMGTAFRELGDRAVFRTVGAVETFDALNIRRSRGELVRWVPLDAFTAQVASFDIGVVPLRDSTFNRSKSWLKGLEYASLGVPFVASPTAEYKRLAKLGVGDLVSTTTRNTTAWARTLLRLIEDPEYRRLRAEEGRIQAAAMTYEAQAEKWLQAWGDALSMRRAS